MGVKQYKIMKIQIPLYEEQGSSTIIVTRLWAGGRPVAFLFATTT
jgi:hypothetical protein